MIKPVIIIPVFTEEDRNLLPLTVKGINYSTENIRVLIYSKIQILPFDGTITLIDKNLSILTMIKLASKFPEAVLCKPGVVFLDKDWIRALTALITNNRNSLIGAICQSGKSRIKGYTFNKKLLTLSPVPINTEVGEGFLVRYLIATTGDSLKELAGKFIDKGYDWDIQITEYFKCIVSLVEIDVSKVNKKFNLRKV